jgi:hypothetical protein
LVGERHAVANAWVDALSAPATVAIMRRSGFGLA